MSFGDTILDPTEEAGNDENWFILDNKSTFNAFINVKYLPNFINNPDGQYIRVH